VADLNGDGIPELVVQNQEMNLLVGLQRTIETYDNENDAFEKVWSIHLLSPIFPKIAVSCGTVPQLLFGTDESQLVRNAFSVENSPRVVSSAAAGITMASPDLFSMFSISPKNNISIGFSSIRTLPSWVNVMGLLLLFPVKK